MKKIVLFFLFYFLLVQVRSVAWSPGHSEMLASVGAAERSLAFCNWRIDPVVRLYVPSFGQHKVEFVLFLWSC